MIDRRHTDDSVTVRVVPHFHDLVARVVLPVRHHDECRLAPVSTVCAGLAQIDPTFSDSHVVGHETAGKGGDPVLVMGDVSTITTLVYVQSITALEFQRSLHSTPVQTVLGAVTVQSIVTPRFSHCLYRLLAKARHRARRAAERRVAKDEHLVRLISVLLWVDENRRIRGPTSALEVEHEIGSGIAREWAYVQLRSLPVHPVFRGYICNAGGELTPNVVNVFCTGADPAFIHSINGVFQDRPMAGAGEGTIPRILRFQQWIVRVLCSMLYSPCDVVMLNEIIG